MDLTAVALYAGMEPWAQACTGLVLLALLALVSRFVVQGVLLHFVRLWRRAMPAMGWAPILLHDHVLVRLAKIVPSVVVQLGIHWVQHLPPNATKAIGNLATALTVYHVVRVVATLLGEINDAHDRHDGPKATQTHSIKSYVQLAKLVAYIVGALLIAAAIMDRSPLLLLSGLGAMSAVLMLVFKDTILSFVAGVQIASNDMMRAASVGRAILAMLVPSEASSMVSARLTSMPVFALADKTDVVCSITPTPCPDVDSRATCHFKST